MFRKLVLIVLLFSSVRLMAQTGIGTTSPDPSAKLDVTSTNKGFLPPRVTLTSGTDNSTISNPAVGLLVYNTGNNAGLVAGYYYWNGSSWATIATASGSGVSSSFMRGSRSSAQTTGISAGGLVAFNQTDNVSGQEISLNTTTGQITLAAGRTYRLIAQVPNFQTSSGDSRPQFGWYNETSGAYIGSSSSAYAAASTANYGAFGGISEAVITTTTNTVISFRILQPYNMNQIGGNADFSTTGAYPWFDVQVISGNTAVNGQSVDYVSVTRTGSDLTVNNTSEVVVFNTNNGGNIPYNTTTGLFTLTAGKTYKLIAGVSLSNGNTAAKEVSFNWKNAAGDILGSKGEMLSPSANVNAAGSGIAYAIYTPLTNTTVGLYVNYSSASTILWQNFSFASIEQIGSSAIVNPWTLSGTNTYNTTGNVAIGNNAPAATLDVTGTVGVSGVATLKDLVKVGTGIGDEGGEINFAVPATNTTLSTRVVQDIWQNRLRFFDGNTKGVFIDLDKAPIGVSGEISYKASGIVNAGTFVQLDNLKATVTTSGNRSLGIASVSGSFAAYVNGSYTVYSGGSSGAGNYLTVSTTLSYAINWNFAGAGDLATYIINDVTNGRVYRVIMMIGPGYNNNFISIERLH